MLQNYNSAVHEPSAKLFSISSFIYYTTCIPPSFRSKILKYSFFNNSQGQRLQRRGVVTRRALNTVDTNRFMYLHSSFNCSRCTAKITRKYTRNKWLVETRTNTAVVQCLYRMKINYKTVSTSRKNVFLRIHFIIVYCVMYNTSTILYGVTCSWQWPTGGKNI